MILLDDFRAEIEAAVKLDIDEADVCLEAISDAAVYAFDKRLVDMAAEAISSADEVLPHIRLPAPVSWLEFDLGAGARIGLFAKAHDNDLVTAQAVVVRKGSGPVKCIASNASIDLSSYGLRSILDEKLTRQIYGCIALLAAPDVIERRRVEVGKLNKKRSKSGKPPLADHDFVRLRLQRVNADDAQALHEAKPEHASAGGRRKQHFVRCHLRFYKSSGLTLVRPHWRGDPSLGVQAPRHMVSL